MRHRTVPLRRLSGHRSWLMALAWLLPWVQGVALWHGYGHVPAQMQALAQAPAARVAPAEAQDLACALCVAAAAVLSAAPPLAVAATLAGPVAAGVSPRLARVGWYRLAWPAYAARAPPVPLS